MSFPYINPNVDYRALTLSLDSIFLVALAVQVGLCTFLLTRPRRALPSRAAVFTLLGGTIIQLAGFATRLAEDVRKTGIPWGRTLSDQSLIYQIVEGLLANFGYIAVLASIFIMLHRSGKGTKIERRMGMVVMGGALVLIVTLGLNIGSTVYGYQTNQKILNRRGPIAEIEQILRAAYYVQRGLSITGLVLNVALIVVLALGARSNPVHHIRQAISCGLIPIISVRTILSAIGMGLYYSEQHVDILSSPAYIYAVNALYDMMFVLFPACVLYVGYGWTGTLTDPSYVTQSSVEQSSAEEIVRKP